MVLQKMKISHQKFRWLFWFDKDVWVISDKLVMINDSFFDEIFEYFFDWNDGSEKFDEIFWNLIKIDDSYRNHLDQFVWRYSYCWFKDRYQMFRSMFQLENPLSIASMKSMNQKFIKKKWKLNWVQNLEFSVLFFD